MNLELKIITIRNISPVIAATLLNSDPVSNHNREFSKAASMFPVLFVYGTSLTEKLFFPDVVIAKRNEWYNY